MNNMMNMNRCGGPNGCNQGQGMNQNCGCCSHQSQGTGHNRCCRNTDSSVTNDPLLGMPVGMGYVPWQQWGQVYNMCDSLRIGTIFPALNLEFYGCIPRNMSRGMGKGGAV